MDSLFLQRTENLVSSGGLRSGGGGGESGLREDNENNHIPAWKLPLTSSLIGNSSNRQQQHHHNGYENKPTVHHHKISIESSSSSSSSSSNNNINLKTVAISPELAEDEATAQLIQILLPCIICNRTFSPEALERHSKICTAVNEKSPLKPNRGKFDSAEQRKKDTKLESFIPPPEIDSNGEFVRSGSRRFRDSFSRGSKNRSSLGKTSTTTTTTTNNSSSSLIPTWRKGITSPLKPSHSLLEHHNNKSMLLGNEPFEDNSEFGSEESQDAISNADGPPINLPHYARALSPSEDCPYCGRNFGMKAFDRHVKFCKELYIRKQYDIQPIPDEKKEALERQELRTKYRQMKGSNSCGSLRSMSPPKDFPSMMAMKLYGFMNKTFNRNNFKKSNESLTNSCYGDYTRSMRRTSPAPSMMSNSSIGMGMGHHHNQHHQIPKAAMVYQRSNSTCSPMSVNSKGSSVMKVNTTSNIPKRTKSIENLASVQCSGYGNGGGQQQYSNNSHGGGGNSFTRNSKTRSSLHKNFFRNSAKRAEPEGTENTQSGSPGALIITPMSFYSKGKNYHGNSSASFLQQQQQHKQQQHVGVNNNPNNSNTTMMMMNRNNNMRNHDNNGGGGLMSEHHHHGLKKGILSSDPHYDPYEKAARQFEELLKSQPPTNRINSNKQQSRKTGLDRAFQSVVIPEPDYDNSSPTPPPPPLHNNQDNPRYPSILNKTSILDTSYSNNDSDKMEVNSSSSPTTTTINSNVNPPADNDRLLSYWEQILQSDHHHHLNKSVQETQEDSQAVSSDSDHSKSRDSAFSRSDGADLEFEALESMLSVGDEPSPQQPQPPSNNKDGPVQKPSLLPTVIGSTRKSSSDHGMVSSSPLSTVHSQSQQRQNSIGTLDTTTTTLPSLLSSSSSSTPNQHPHEYKHLSRFQNGNENNYANHHSSSGGGNNEYSTTDQKSFSKPSVSSSGGNGNGALARFCYECGTCYPTPTAKFCPECGERRVMK